MGKFGLGEVFGREGEKKMNGSNDWQEKIVDWEGVW